MYCTVCSVGKETILGQNVLFTKPQPRFDL